MEIAISMGPDQTAPLRMSFDQGLHYLIRPVRLNTCLGIGWLHATLFFFSLSLLCISRTPIRMSCSSRTLAVDIHCCCCCCICCCCLRCCCCLCCYCCCLVCIKQLTIYPSFPESMPKPVAIADTKEIGKFIENPHVTRVVFPLTGMDGSLTNFAFNFRFYSFIHTDWV